MIVSKGVPDSVRYHLRCIKTLGKDDLHFRKIMKCLKNGILVVKSVAGCVGDWYRTGETRRIVKGVQLVSNQSGHAWSSEIQEDTFSMHLFHFFAKIVAWKVEQVYGLLPRLKQEDVARIDNMDDARLIFTIKPVGLKVYFMYDAAKCRFEVECSRASEWKPLLLKHPQAASHKLSQMNEGRGPMLLACIDGCMKDWHREGKMTTTRRSVDKVLVDDHEFWVHGNLMLFLERYCINAARNLFERNFEDGDIEVLKVDPMLFVQLTLETDENPAMVRVTIDSIQIQCSMKYERNAQRFVVECETVPVYVSDS